MEESETGCFAVGMPLPPARPARAERRDAMEHRHRILEVARQLFAEQGVGAVSMHQIARAAGIGQGTLYRRYAHKGELCMDLLHERAERFAEEIALTLAERSNSPALERLDMVLEHVLVLLEEQGALLCSIADSTLHQLVCEERARGAKLQRSPFHEWLHNLLAFLLGEAVERGEIAALDVSFTADALLATINPLFYLYQRHERGFAPERILQGLRHLYIVSIKSHPS